MNKIGKSLLDQSPFTELQGSPQSVSAPLTPLACGETGDSRHERPTDKSGVTE